MNHKVCGGRPGGQFNSTNFDDKLENIELKEMTTISEANDLLKKTSEVPENPDNKNTTKVQTSNQLTFLQKLRINSNPCNVFIFILYNLSILAFGLVIGFHIRNQGKQTNIHRYPYIRVLLRLLVFQGHETS